jgi:hypothetical protein
MKLMPTHHMPTKHYTVRSVRTFIIAAVNQNTSLENTNLDPHTENVFSADIMTKVKHSVTLKCAGHRILVSPQGTRAT